MRCGTTSASACTDRMAALAALNSCPPPSQFCVVRAEGWKVRETARGESATGVNNVIARTHVAVRDQVGVCGDVGRARGGHDAPRVGSDGRGRARGETAAARERAPHGGERERRRGRHRGRKCVGDDEAPASISPTAARSSGSDLGMSATEKKNGPSHFFPNDQLRLCLGGTMSACQIFGFRVCGAQPRHGRVASARHTSTRASTSRRRTPPNAAKLALRTPPASAARARDRHPRSHTLTTPHSSIGHRKRFVVP